MYQHTFVGLDVHAASVVGCALIPETGEMVQEKMDSDPAVVLEWIRRFEPPVKAVYESGPTGYVLARYLREADVDCVVAAASKLLRAPGDKVKTDRRDARILTEMLALGQVTEVRVPTRAQEDLRDLSRLRARAAKNLAHARQHVNAVLLRHGIRYPKETKWTQEHRVWLHRQHFESPVLQFTYEADVEQAELLAEHLKRIDHRVAEVARDCEYTPVIEALMCLRGIQVTTGFGLAVEIGDWTRFTGANIGSYLGLVPSEQSSGQARHQGRSRRPAASTPAGCSSRRPGCTGAPTPGPGSGCCGNWKWSARPPGSGPWKATTASIANGKSLMLARNAPSRRTLQSRGNLPAGAGLWLRPCNNPSMGRGNA
ncbi:IS110 family transposase [Crystallibacter degradans]|uniref:IS110 family transposase n=1 Tax=Crystallibacter degradans TaxID=2726743 RepID=UPI001F0FABD1|nr:IS110 family transposase [Arthrobacter sp. SF27]